MKLIVSCLFILFITGCATTNQPKKQPNYSNENHSKSRVSKKLYSQYRSWKGVKYRLGGSSKRGVDCSAFTQITFKDQFNKKIPRTTAKQVKLGRFVLKRNLRKGDLIFFKTGRNVRHVGVYMGNRKFLHASTSKGVIISSIDNVYWKSKYWKSRRIL